MRLAYVAAKDRLPEYSGKFSRKDFTLPQLFACRLNWSRGGVTVNCR